MLFALALLACGPRQTTIINNNYYVVDDADEPSYDATTGAPDATLDTLDVDVWADGHVYWFGVTPEQVAQMNADWQNGAGFDYLYDLEVGTSDATYADPTFVGGPDGFFEVGKVELRLIGQSTGVAWEASAIPNLRVDTDEFQSGVRIGGQEHLRFNNGQVGGILRESIALDVYRLLGVPVPRASFAWVGASIWGEDVRVPYTLTEVYKDDFCMANADLLGGTCVNLWEGTGDVTAVSVGSLVSGCQLGTCDDTRLRELVSVVDSTPPAEGFEAATADYIDWTAFQRFQCLSWMLWTGDDYIHNMNNLVVVERADGKFQFLPYSVDISAGQSWYQYTALNGWTSLPLGCQSDPTCWAETLDTCEALIDEFAAIDPVRLVDDTYARLQAEGMVRGPDPALYHEVRGWYERRLTDLPAELEGYRNGGFDTGLDTGADTGK